MINEFKVKMAYLLNKKKLPPVLFGYVLYQYLNTNCRRIYAQNHKKDYLNSHFLYTIFNNAHVNRILKDAQKKGILRMK
jgi:hypothetical protein